MPARRKHSRLNEGSSYSLQLRNAFRIMTSHGDDKAADAARKRLLDNKSRALKREGGRREGERNRLPRFGRQKWFNRNPGAISRGTGAWSARCIIGENSSRFRERAPITIHGAKIPTYRLPATGTVLVIDIRITDTITADITGGGISDRGIQRESLTNRHVRALWKRKKEKKKISTREYSSLSLERIRWIRRLENRAIT